MSRWISLGIAALALALLAQGSNVEARGRSYGYCPNCQYSMPKLALPAAQAPAPPADTAAVAPAPAAPAVRAESASYRSTYYQNAPTRRGRWFGRYRG